MNGLLIALGGNAIVEPGEEGNLEQQYANTAHTMREIAAVLLDFGGPLVLTHGNGPQIGNILARSELSSGRIYPLTLDVCVSDSEGGMGYMIQQVLHNELLRRGVERDVVTLITQTEVNPNDPAFQNPTKFIGKAFDTGDVERLQRERGWLMKEDRGRGWRRVVPSPRPQRVVEAAVVGRMIERGTIVIAAGGGGVPVAEGEEGGLFGIEAVVDKDLAAAMLARACELDTLAIVTAVDRVCVNFGAPNERPLERVTLDEAQRYFDEGQFPPGSMGPKIEAAMNFIMNGGSRVVITSPGNLQAALDGKAGTTIIQ